MEIARNTPVQTFWAQTETVKDGKMTAVRLDDAEAKYFNVLLGLGAVIQTPVPGSRVLLGIVDNKKTACFLIYAEELQSISVNAAKENLGKLMNELFVLISQLTVTTGTGPSGPPINVAAFNSLKSRFNKVLK